MAGRGADQQAIGLQNVADTPQPAFFSFIPDKDSEVLALLKTVGRVTDVTLDAETSNLVCPSTSNIDTEMVIQVNAKNMEGETITAEDVEKSQLQVEVTARGHDSIPQHMLTSSSSSSSLVARYRPMVTGQYKVSATVHGKHLKGSPAQVKVDHRLNALDPAMCHHSLVLSNNNQTVRKKKTGQNGFACVLGTDRYVTGQHDINIRLTEIQPDSHGVIGVTSHEEPPLNSQSHEPGLAAWHTRITFYFDDTSGDWDANIAVGQPWRSGDVINLHLDCDQHTAMLTHQRTGKFHTASNVTGTLRLFLSLYHKNEQFTIIP